MSFYISFQPSGKDNNYIGPFEIKGPTINGMPLKAINKFKAEKTPSVRVFIDQITIKKDGVTAISSALRFIAKP